jgi:glycosyltransferase involved in cell wall biosynthesis
MQALLRAGIAFDITTLKTPDVSKLESSFGRNFISVMNSANKINIINILEELREQMKRENEGYYKYDITINTNGDAAPYYHSSFSKDNTITYCHFPSTKYHIESENIEYLRTDLGLPAMDYEDNTSSKSYKTHLHLGTRRDYFEVIKYGYLNLMRNSILITNSEFSRRAIINAFGLEDVRVLSPPIDIKTFRKAALKANEVDQNDSKDIILVIARIAPHKKIENAIKLAKILKDNNIGNEMKIIGNLYHYFLDYYLELKQMVLDLGLTNYVTFEINASFDRLLSIIRRSRVYFHPMVGEHFGMSAIEAMTAGLIAIVPNEGGITEFVPQQYQFKTIEHAAEIITYVINHVPRRDRIKISKSMNKFSNLHYIEGFQIILNELVPLKKTNNTSR